MGASTYRAAYYGAICHFHMRERYAAWPKQVDQDAMNPIGEPVSVTTGLRQNTGTGYNAFTVCSTGVLASLAGNAFNEQQDRWHTPTASPTVRQWFGRDLTP